MRQTVFVSHVTLDFTVLMELSTHALRKPQAPSTQRATMIATAAQARMARSSVLIKQNARSVPLGLFALLLL
jgi:hypothetical protein